MLLPVRSTSDEFGVSGGTGTAMMSNPCIGAADAKADGAVTRVVGARPNAKGYGRAANRRNRFTNGSRHPKFACVEPTGGLTTETCGLPVR